MDAQADVSLPLTFRQLLREIDRQGVGLRMTGDGRLQAAGVTAELRPALRQHRVRLKARVRSRGAPLEVPRVRWAYPPCSAKWLAWAEGHPAQGEDKESVPPGLDVANWNASGAEGSGVEALPIFGFTGETRRHVQWLCRPPGTGAEALPGRMTAEPFTLVPGCRVTDPLRLIVRLRSDVTDGPDGPRARTGALQDDLRRLYQRFAAAPHLRASHADAV